jgi:hypothetical protein
VLAVQNDQEIMFSRYGASPPGGIATLDFMFQVLAGQDAGIRETPGIAENPGERGSVTRAGVAYGYFETLVQHWTSLARSARKRTYSPAIRAK